MVWTADGSQGFESSKIAHLAVPYLQGKCLDIGCGMKKVWPSLIGIDSLKDYGTHRPADIDVVGEGESLSYFSDAAMDGVFSSHFLEHVVDFKACLKEWWRVIKPDGYLVLYLPHKKFYPNIGERGSNPDHKHDFMPDDIIEAMKQIGSWELLENEERSKGEEYSFYQVYRKRKGTGKHIFNVFDRNPKGQKRCLVIRYGAIGDAILSSSILPLLKKDGFHITYNTAPNGYDILKNDPHVDEWLLQGKDFVPNAELGPYWQGLKYEGRYDRIVNLCESIEGGLLTLPGRLQHDYPDAVRRKMFASVNYIERTHDIAGVEYEFLPKFYPDIGEIAKAKKRLANIDGPVVLWAINGSAQHKYYPYIQVVTSWLLEHSPAHVFLLGDSITGKDLQTGILEALKKDGIDTTKVHPVAGELSIRDALTLAQMADCVVGPETGILNAVCSEENKKVIYLSHSSEENLTKHWKNTITLLPDAKKAPCYPCSRLHYNWDHCFQDTTTKTSICAASVTPKMVFEAIMTSLNFKKVVRQYEPELPPDGTNSARKAA